MSVSSVNKLTVFTRHIGNINSCTSFIFRMSGSINLMKSKKQKIVALFSKKAIIYLNSILTEINKNIFECVSDNVLNDSQNS